MQSAHPLQTPAAGNLERMIGLWGINPENLWL
jgi:hypothetical protein